MTIFREMPIHDPILFRIGDKIEININGIGMFRATVHKTSDEGTIFIFDNCITQRQMNAEPDFEGGFKESHLYKYLNKKILPKIEPAIREHIEELLIPSYGMIFGKSEWQSIVLSKDEDYQLPLMSDVRNRISQYIWTPCPYWLSNRLIYESGGPGFEAVHISGNSMIVRPTTRIGVRPMFIYKKEKVND